MKKIAWKKPTSGPSAPPLPPEIHAVTVRGITAHFGGEKPPGDFQLEFGVSALWFTFAGDETVYVFSPGGDVDFGDWRFDLFSASGAYVLLQQDHYGPYHVVAIERLKEYLRSPANPDKVVSGHDHPSFRNSPAQVHRLIRWTSDGSFEFSGFCCGDEMHFRYDIQTGKLELMDWKPVHPRRDEPPRVWRQD